MDQERPEYITNNKYCLTHDESIVDLYSNLPLEQIEPV